MRAADSRLREVLIHHVDLNADYKPAQWPTGFVRDMLGRVVASCSARDDVPAMRVYTTDSETSYDIGTARSRVGGTVVVTDHASISAGQVCVLSRTVVPQAVIVGR